MAEPAWLEIARAELGVTEKGGRATNPRVTAYFEASGHREIKDDETAWCSAFANYCMVEAGYKGTMSLAARSWLQWGKETKPQPGAILVFSRGASSWQGHVAFMVGETPTHYEVLGGNQGNAVSIRGYSKSRLLGARWPATMKRSRTVKAAAVGGVSSGANFLIEQAQEAKYVTEGLQDYVSWAGYAAAALAVVCFVLVAWFKWTDIRDKG